MPAVEVEQLVFRYGDRVALNDVGFTVPAGDVFGLLGPNGGGKSTLFRVLSTLLPIQEGSAQVCGHSVLSDPDAVRRCIGVTFQSPSLDLKLTVAENLKHQGHLYGLYGAELRTRCQTVMAQLGVADRANDFAEKLSGGLKRRVEIAKSLLHSPEILLLDEPSTGLDPRARHDLWETLLKLQKESEVTILVTTHLMEEAARCGRLGILDEGKLIALGTPDELQAMVGGDSLTIQAENQDQLAAQLRQQLHVDVQKIGETLRIEQENGHELLVQIATQFPGQFQNLTLGKPTLEDVFIKLTGRRLDEGEAA
ncbi:ABC transporter ATP-binding protein [Thalassoglobus polymorphus]|uniref:Daunorubicin/doxorubicin resistance ATP-binding protein DrrA n=1 Tax=Thalassoglobus polymorphus TaxID=2527994 RepID=A0A517QRW4_9PLAN|nr:ABC transporter ATP-binding protein [Thalassoglobus polymorphus]QDT34358.1 Daunorubicin/doxorubicin resistance ATP-binding protein DrrA [Thalassoglobus polymorphus]